jgi:DNA primase
MNELKPDILTIIEREGLAVKRRKALCPFHDERTPSFIVSQARQTFHCFGCGAHGDVITFIMKLKGLSFKDALSYLGMAPGKPAPIDPDIQRRRKLQQSFEKAIAYIYDKLCARSRHLHQIRLQVKKNPGALTDLGAALFAEQMGELTEIDHKLDVLLTGTVEDQISMLMETMKNDCKKTISRAA